MSERPDARLEEVLRLTLREEAEHLPLRLTPDAVEGWPRRSAVRRRRRPLLVLGLAAALVMPLGLLALSNRQEPVPAGAWRAILVRGTEPEVPADATQQGQDAPRPLIAGDLEVVAVAADGRERIVARIPAERLPDAGWTNLIATVSDTGRLAVTTFPEEDAVTFVIDLGDPEGEPQVFALGLVAWDASGRLWHAAYDESLGSLDEFLVEPGTSGDWSFWGPRLITPDAFTLQVVDPETGDGRSVPAPPDGSQVVIAPPGGPYPAADGSGVLVGVATSNHDGSLLFDQTRPGDPPLERQLGIMGIDGSTTEGGWPSLGLTPGRRWLSPTEGVLQVCGSPDVCPGEPRGAVVSGGDGPQVRTWYRDALPYEVVLAASWDAQGSRPWLLALRRFGEPAAVLARASTDLTVDPAPISVTLPATPAWGAEISGVAPDDSIVAFREVFAASPREFLVATGDGRASSHEGVLAGFLTADVADALGTGVFSAGPVNALAPAATHDAAQVPVLPTLEEQVAAICDTGLSLAGCDGVADPGVIRHLVDGPALPPVDGPPAPTVGPIDFPANHGVIYSISCSGLGDVRFTNGPFESEFSNDCLSPAPEIRGSGIGDVAAEDVTITVTSAPDTVWRLIVFLLPPDGAPKEGEPDAS